MSQCSIISSYQASRNAAKSALNLYLQTLGKLHLVRSLSERERIVSKKKDRPYGVRVVVAVADKFGGAELLGVEEAACLILNGGLVVEMRRKRNSNTSQWWREYQFTVDAFSTAGQAEEAGLRMASALLWMSISLHTPKLMLRYTGPLPCDVYDRRRGSGGAGIHATGWVDSGSARQLDALEAAWRRKISDRQLLLAMELFCAARLGTTLRSRFVGMISSLEPLSVQSNYAEEAYGPTLANLIRSLLGGLQEAEGIPQGVRRSLEGRIRDLRRESVRQAYLRLARQSLEEREVRAMDEAYNLRSEMLHDGTTDPDLEEVARSVEGLISKIFAHAVGLPCIKNTPPLPIP